MLSKVHGNTVLATVVVGKDVERPLYAADVARHGKEAYKTARAVLVGVFAAAAAFEGSTVRAAGLRRAVESTLPMGGRWSANLHRWEGGEWHLTVTWRRWNGWTHTFGVA